MTTPPDSPTPAAEGTPTPTPRTDACLGPIGKWVHFDVRLVAVARQLERELTSTQQALAEAREQARLGWERHAEKDRAYGDMIKQRDDAVDAKNAMLEQLEKHTDGFMRANFRVTSLERQIAGIEWTDAAKKLLYENDALKAQLATLRQQNEALRRDGELLAQIADIFGARIKLGVSAYNAEAVKRYNQARELLRDYWDAKNEAEDRAAQQGEGKEPNLGSTPAPGAINVGTKGEAPGSLIDG